MSGDGEPTSSPIFDDMVHLCADIRRRRGLDQVKLVLITNATLLHRERVRKALEVLDANNGEIWGKLDAGTEEYYRRSTARSQAGRGPGEPHVAARQRPIVIQSLFMRLEQRAAAAGRAGGLLRSAERNRRCRRADQVGADPHHRPPRRPRALPLRWRMPKSTPWRSWSGIAPGWRSRQATAAARIQDS